MPRGRGGKIERRDPLRTRVFDAAFDILAVPSGRPLYTCDKIAESDRVERSQLMCRNIKTLFNFDPPATEEEVRAASLQFVRKLSGFNKPSQANKAAFDHAVDEVAHIAGHLLASLETHAPHRDRDVEAAKAKARSAERFARA